MKTKKKHVMGLIILLHTQHDNITRTLFPCMNLLRVSPSLLLNEQIYYYNKRINPRIKTYRRILRDQVYFNK